MRRIRRQATAAGLIASSATAFGQATGPAELSRVEVVGRSVSGTYLEAETVGATRTATPLRELPQSVRVLPRQLLDDIGATRLDDSFDYVSGISRQNNFGGSWDNFSVRGFSGNENTGPNFLRNGLGGNRGISAPRDTANVDRIEFLKGPAAALYGSSEPGGTLNVVTKKPRFVAGHSAEAYYGSYAMRRVAVDSTGPLSDAVAYRLNVAAEDKNSFRDFIETRRLLVAPALSWRLSGDTTLSYDGEYLRQKSPFDRGIVAGNGGLGALDALPRSRFLGEPADGDFDVTSQTHQLIAEHRLDEAWRVQAGLSYRKGSLDGFSSEAAALQSNGTALNRQRRFRDYGSDDVSAQAELIGKLALAGVDHDVLVGVDAYRLLYDQRQLRINPSATAPYAIDVFAPVYGQPQPTPNPNVDTHERQRNGALYLQDEVSLASQWKLLAGLRVDRYRQHLDNHRSGVTTEQQKSATSPRIGITYLANANWSVYANAGKSFRPNAGATAAGAAFDPERARAVEAGVKFESSDHRLGGTVAVFEIRKRNVLTADPATANAGFSVAAGEVRSRGLEFDLAGQITRNLRLTASYAWLDAEVTKDNTALLGKPLIGVPRSSASALAVWEDGLATGGRFGAGGGFTYVGARPGNSLATFSLPGYTTVKLVGYWRINPMWRVSLDVDNAFDRRYDASSYSSVWITPGSPRLATLGLQAKF